jgi:hypothetical protein
VAIAVAANSMASDRFEGIIIVSMAAQQSLFGAESQLCLNIELNVTVL